MMAKKYSAGNWLTNITQVVGAKYRREIVSWVVSRKDNAYWASFWKKYSNFLAGPSMVIEILAKQGFGLPEFVESIIINYWNDFLDEIKARARLAGAAIDATGEVVKTATVPADSSVYTIRQGVVTISDIVTMYQLLFVIDNLADGRGEELLSHSGEKDYIDKLVQKLVDTIDTEAAFNKLTESILGKKVSPKAPELITAAERLLALKPTIYKIFNGRGINASERKAFISHLKSLGTSAKQYLDTLESITNDVNAVIKREIKAVYKESFDSKKDGFITHLKRAYGVVKRSQNIYGRRLTHAKAFNLGFNG